MEKISQSTSQSTSQDISDGISQDKSLGISQGATQGTSQGTSGRASQRINKHVNNKPKQEQRSQSGRREQSGHFHVWIRGNCRFTVFYEDNDFVGFLKRCDAVAKKYDTKIAAFLVLDNHIHLHVITETLSPFASALLIGLSQWLNKRNGFRGKLFESPFGSSRIYSKALIAENLLYIFSNPMNAGICTNPWEYKWSSYHFHNSTRKNPLENLINIDSSTVNSSFPTKGSLDKAIFDFNLNGSPTQTGSPIQTEKSNWPRIPDFEAARCMNTILNGAKLSELSKDELKKLMVVLRQRDGATYRQISSLTHESYVEVRRIL